MNKIFLIMFFVLLHPKAIEHQWMTAEQEVIEVAEDDADTDPHLNLVSDDIPQTIFLYDVFGSPLNDCPTLPFDACRLPYPQGPPRAFFA